MPAPAPLPGFLEVEIGTYCNRQCAWCPNGWHDRGLAGNSKAMADATFAALIDDLHEYRGWFAFHNYNEPMADPRLLERMRQARAAMPRARLELHTNGDFLTQRSLAGRLRADAGDALPVERAGLGAARRGPAAPPARAAGAAE